MEVNKGGGRSLRRGKKKGEGRHTLSPPTNNNNTGSDSSGRMGVVVNVRKRCGMGWSQRLQWGEGERIDHRGRHGAAGQRVPRNPRRCY